MSASLIIQSLGSVPGRCRCGGRIVPGATEFRVMPDSPASEPLFHGQVFCSLRCLRAFCLESLETLNELDTPASEEVVVDLHELYRGVAQAFAETLA